MICPDWCQADSPVWDPADENLTIIHRAVVGTTPTGVAVRLVALDCGDEERPRRS